MVALSTSMTFFLGTLISGWPSIRTKVSEKGEDETKKSSQEEEENAVSDPDINWERAHEKLRN